MKIQWGFAHFFPASTISAHVTRMGNRPPKFACDVALQRIVRRGPRREQDDAEERQITEGGGGALQEIRLRAASSWVVICTVLDSPYERPRASLEYVYRRRLEGRSLRLSTPSLCYAELR